MHGLYVSLEYCWPLNDRVFDAACGTVAMNSEVRHVAGGVCLHLPSTHHVALT